MSPRELNQKIRFVASKDGTRIATATTGTGPPIVRAAHWLTHVSHDIESPVWRHWIEALSSQNTLIRYDLRGCGLSQRDVPDIGFDAWLADLEAVTEDIEAPFTLLGMSQGGALSIAYALKHPERVERLCLIGAYAQGLRARESSPQSTTEAETLTNLIRLGWGQKNNAFNRVFTNLFIPEGTPEQQSWWQDLERETTSPENAALIFEVLQRIDILEMLPSLSVPTLVMHARQDARIPFAEGKRLAEQIPGAQFVPLNSANHVLLESEPAWAAFQSSFRDFLQQAPNKDLCTADASLTKAETGVLDLVAEGLSNAEIATALNKSEKTVRNQVSTLYEKFGVHSRAELIVRVLSAARD